MFLNFIWDFDGTLFHTYDGMLLALKMVLKDNGINDPDEEILGRLKTTLGEALDYYSKKYNLDKSYMEAKFREYEEKYGYELMVPFEGLEEILKYIKKAGGRSFIYTHRNAVCNKLIEKYKLTNYFTEIVTKEYGLGRKPDPKGFNYIIDKYNLKKEETLAVGDRDLDLLAGKNSGTEACLFLSKGSAYSENADFVIYNLIDLKDVIDGRYKLISLDSYENLSDYYFNYVDNKPYNAFYERPATLSLLSDIRGKKILDAGCAAGFYTEQLIKRGGLVTALDFSPSMLKMTKLRVGDGAKLFLADLNKPLNMFQDESFDIILSSLTLHYIENWDIPLSEFNRILKKGGQLIFSVHHPFMDFTVFNKENYFKRDLIEDTWKTNKGNINVTFYRRSLNEITESLYKAGFLIERIIEPFPTEDFKKRDFETYLKLTKKPQFLFVKALKENKK